MPKRPPASIMTTAPARSARRYSGSTRTPSCSNDRGSPPCPRDATPSRLLGSSTYLPARRNHAARSDPSIAVILLNPDCAGTKSNNGRPFASADQTFHVANRLSDPLGELLLRENFLQLATPFVDCRELKAQVGSRIKRARLFVRARDSRSR